MRLPDRQFDLITFCETIEHLYTSPTLVLAFLKGLLRPGPGVGILIQTPNAASLLKRRDLLLGRNPNELIRTQRTNPGHFREYTMNELLNYAAEAGLTVWHAEYCSYWPAKGPVQRLLEGIPSLRQGITILLTR